MLSFAPKEKRLILEVRDYDVVLIGTSIYNALGNGFQHDVKLSFPDVDKVNRGTRYGDPNKLGTVTVVKGEPIFCLCYINKGAFRKSDNPEYLDYEALRKCLTLVGREFKGKRIATTLMGHSRYEGDGKEEKIMEIFKETMGGNDVTIYPYLQRDYREEERREWNEIVNGYLEGRTGREEYERLKREFKKRRKTGLI